MRSYITYLKNRKFAKEAPQNSCLERAIITLRQGESEHKDFEVKPTLAKTDSSSRLCILLPLESCVFDGVGFTPYFPFSLGPLSMTKAARSKRKIWGASLSNSPTFKWAQYILGVLLFTPLFLAANPNDPSVVHGEANFELNGNHLTISTSEKAIIEWKNFSINQGEITQFLQPHAQSAVLNRVLSSDPSHLFGTLQSNGKVYLINQNGIVVGSSGLVQTASFIGSTFDVLNQEFLSGGDLVFQGTSSSHLINEGKIEALNGDVILIGQFVKNSGTMTSLNGLCGIGCGEKVLLKAAGEERLFILTPIETQLEVEAGIQQQGVIKSLSTELKASGNPYALAVSHAGTIDALGVRREGKSVFLVAEKGNLHITGEIHAENGTIHLHGDQIILADNSLIDVSGENVGGSVYAGKDPAIKAEPKAIYVSPSAKIRADAKNSGNGGKVILWADEINSFEGMISAKGGPLGGDGGFIEISSPKSFFPKGKVETTALNGQIGTLLLDPCAVTISGGATTVGVTPFAAPGACPLPAQNYMFALLPAAIINNVDLVGYLTCNNVTIDASLSGSAVTGTITVSAPIQWPGMAPVAGTPTTLTLIADGSITINDSIQASYTDPTLLNALVLEAPTITVEALAANLNVISWSGDIVINAPTALNLIGSAGKVLIFTVSNTDGNVTVNAPPIAPGNLTMTSTGGTNTCVLAAQQNLLAYFNNIDLGGDGGGQLGSNGPLSTVNVTADGYCHITGGIGLNAISGLGGNFGPTDLTVGLDIILTGGSGAGAVNASARLQTAVLGGTGNLTIHSATDITLIGGTMGATNAHAVIGTGDITTFSPGGDGNTLINYSGSLSITGGTGDQCYAGIISNGILPTNDITIIGSNPASSITILSNGLASMTAFAGIETTLGGNITISGVGNLTMTGSSTVNPARIQTGLLGGNLSVTSSGTTILNSFADIKTLFPGATLNFSGGNLSLIATTGDVLITGDAGPATVNLSGDLTIQAGSLSNAIIGAAYTSGTGDLNVTAQNINLTGGNGMFSFAQLSSGTFGGGGDGQVFVTATGSGGLSLNGGIGDFGAAFIATWGSGPNNHITITLTDPSADLTMTSTHLTAMFASAAILTGGSTGGGNITINSKRDLIMSAAGTSSPTFIHGSYTMMSPIGGDLLILTGRTLNVGPFSQIQNNYPIGKITLVADNNFPTPPDSGPGEFILAATGSIITASAEGLFIYTANHLQNTIDGSINGPFMGVNLLVNGPNEQWGIYYPENPNGVTGTPYTIFYKEGYLPLVGELDNDFTIAISEAFQLWKTYDRMVYVVKTIEVKYEDGEKMRELLGPDKLSSFDLPSWFYSYFYQAHRNYNTLKLDNRL